MPSNFRLFEQMPLRIDIGASVSQEIRHRWNRLLAKPMAILGHTAIEKFVQIKKDSLSGLSFKYIRPCKGYFAKLTDLVSLITVIFT